MEEFEKLKTEFMPAPFWFWNDRMDEEEVRWQVREMREKNVGGFFIHARMGRVTPYMGREWMKCVRAAVEEADKLGMQAWIYDEDNWPSGYGGGEIVSLGEEYLQKNLICQQFQGGGVIELVPQENAAFFKAYAVGKDGVIHIIDERVSSSSIDTKGLEGWKIFVFYVMVHRFRRYFCPEVWTDGYVDVLNGRVTEEFLKRIYEAYKDEVGQYFGKTVKGFFIDEPNMQEHGWWGGDPVFPWSDIFGEEFLKRRGYDILLHLPSLVEDVGDFMQVRYDFWRTAAELFAENFTGRIARWCEENGVQLTGHFIVEEHLRAQTKCTGNSMWHYRYEHVPGIDHLGQWIELPDFWSSSNVLVKQASSVANQLGRERVMCETFAGGGWNFNMADYRWMGDWMYALGVNLLCPHAFHYSLRSFRKRDYPPSFFYQQPWWEFSELLGAHYARLGYMLTQGEPVRDILIIHPIESVWATHRQQDFDWEGDGIVEWFEKISECLLQHQWDFDYGDEGLMEEFGRVEDGKLWIGKAGYSLVILPPCVRLRESTVKLLREFIKEGGIVFAFEPLPYIVEDERDEDIGGLRSEFDIIKGRGWRRRLLAKLEEKIKRSVKIRCGDTHALRVMHRKSEGCDIVFITNIEDRDLNLRMSVETAGEVEEWVPATGERFAVPVYGEGKTRTFYFDLPGRASRLFVAGVDGAGEKMAQLERPKGREVPIRGKCYFKRLNPNVLLLDYCKINGERKAVARLRELGEGVVSAEFAFRVKHVPEGRVMLLIEEPGRVEKLLLNDEEVEVKDCGWMYDKSFRLLELPALKPGENCLRITYHLKDGMEPPAILGEFGVFRGKDGFYIDKEQDTVKLGSWVEEGYPFYAGVGEYIINLEIDENGGKVWLVIDEFKEAIKVFVNGKELGVWAWPPYWIDMTGFVGEGENEVRIQVASSLHNFLGPHHIKDAEKLSLCWVIEKLMRAKLRGGKGHGKEV